MQGILAPAPIRSRLLPIHGTTHRVRSPVPSRRDKLQLGPATGTGTCAQPTAERRSASPHRPQAHTGPVCIGDPASIIADSHEKISRLPYYDDVDATGRAVQCRVDDCLTSNTNDLLAIHRIEVAATSYSTRRLDSDRDLQTVAVPELVADDAKRGFGGGSSRSRQVGDHAARRGQRVASSNHQRMPGFQLGAESLPLCGDTRQILRKPVVQVAGDPLTL